MYKYKFTTMYKNYMKKDNIDNVQREREIWFTYHKFDNVKGRLLGFESIHADLQAVSHRCFTWLTSLCGQRDRDVPGAALYSYGPPHFHSLSASGSFSFENRERQRELITGFANLVLEVGSIYICIKGESGYDVVVNSKSD